MRRNRLCTVGKGRRYVAFGTKPRGVRWLLPFHFSILVQGMERAEFPLSGKTMGWGMATPCRHAVWFPVPTQHNEGGKQRLVIVWVVRRQQELHQILSRGRSASIGYWTNSARCRTDNVPTGES